MHHLFSSFNENDTSYTYKTSSLLTSYFSLGGSLWEREPGMVSAPLAAVTPAGGCVPYGSAVLLLVPEGGAWDLERSSFLSRWASPPVAGLFMEVPRLASRTPDPENHSPDLVRISCCLRHRLHTHITCRGVKDKSALQHRFSNIKEEH